MIPDLPLIGYSKFSVGAHFIFGLFENIKQLIRSDEHF